MDNLLANYLVQSLEILESHTVSQIRALKGMVLAAKNQPRQETLVKTETQDTDVEQRLEKFLSDLSGVSIKDPGIKDPEEDKDGIGYIREGEETNG